MIEIIHFMNRYGKKKMACVRCIDVTEFYTIREYMDRYYCGLEKPHYPLPALVTNYTCTLGVDTPNGLVHCGLFGLRQCRNCKCYSGVEL